MQPEPQDFTFRKTLFGKLILQKKVLDSCFQGFVQYKYKDADEGDMQDYYRFIDNASDNVDTKDTQ